MDSLKLNGMAVSASELTQKRYRAVPCDLLLNVTPRNKKAAIAAFEKVGEFDKYRGLRLSGIGDLSFLKDFPRLLYLEVVDQKRVDPRPIEFLENLRGLRLESPGAGLDFGRFPELEVFSGDWHADHRNLKMGRELRRLRLRQFNPRSLDLSDLACLTRLEDLELIQTQITSLAGLETLEDLRYLHVAYAPKLESLGAMATYDSGIREFSLSKANKIDSYAPLASIGHLRRLKLTGCAEMDNLKWTAGMNHLDFFSFVETNVADGDLTPLLGLPKLQYVGTMDKRRYNYKCNALNDLLRQRIAAGPAS